MKHNNKNIAILFFTLVVIMLGFGMVIPILPFYIKSFGASGSELGFLMSIYAFMQLIFSPIWGGLSDRYGRKPILMLGVFGNALAQLLFGLSTQLWMLFAARVMAGVLSSATLPTAMAYVGDSTSEEQRGGGMGILGAAMGIGMVIGPGIAGWLASKSLSTPFFLAAALSLVALLALYIALPESLREDERSAPSATIRGPQIKEMWEALFSPIGLLLLMAFLMSFGMTNFEGIFGLFALEKFGYGTRQVGFLLSVIGIISAIAMGTLTGPLTRRWGEVAIIRVSLLISAIGFILMVFAYNFATVLITISFFILGVALLRPVTSSLTSKRAEVGQGIAMGMNNAFMSLGRTTGPLIAGLLFDINMDIPYIVGSGIMFIGFFISIIWLEQETKIPVELKREAPLTLDR